jgi:hypothetical protein
MAMVVIVASTGYMEDCIGILTIFGELLYCFGGRQNQQFDLASTCFALDFLHHRQSAMGSGAYNQLVLRKKSMRPHAAISSSQYSWCSPPRTSRARIRQLAGNSCRWMLGRGRGLLSESGMPGPKLP